MSTASPTKDERIQARFEYERATTTARHSRDKKISQAWLAFKKQMNAAWTKYREVEDPFVNEEESGL